MIVDHGMWQIYTPAVLPEHAPSGAIYSRKVETGEDWYQYQKKFDGSTVVMTAQPLEDGSYLVQAVHKLAQHIFPGIWRVIEDTEYTGSDPFTDYNGYVYNADSRKIGDKYVRPRIVPPPTETETKILGVLDTIVTRLERLERDK